MVVLGCCHVPSAWAAPHSGRARDGSFARGVVAARSRGVASAPAVASARPVAPGVPRLPAARARFVRARVRRMTPRDLPRVVEVLTAAADPARVSPRGARGVRARAAAAHPRDEVALVAECALTPLSTPAVVGVVGVLFSDRIKPPEMKLGGQDVAYVTNLAVDELARRRGVGRALLRAAERAARRNGSRRVACRVDDDNDAARRMYDREGYAPFEPPGWRRFERSSPSCTRRRASRTPRTCGSGRAPSRGWRARRPGPRWTGSSERWR